MSDRPDLLPIRLNQAYVGHFQTAVHDGDAADFSEQLVAVLEPYAIVFDTTGLNKLLDAEVATFDYQFMNFSDCDYDDHGAGVIAPHPEKQQWEAALQEAVRDFVLEKDLSLNRLSTVVPPLSCRYKHHGFSEESEVRIVAVPSNDELRAMPEHSGRALPKKPVEFWPRGGVLVPGIMLFGGSPEAGVKLPIQRVIVGPHPEKQKRAKAAQLMLRQAGIDAEVIVSDIPYLGR